MAMTHARSKKILLVEDNPDDEELTRRAFRKAGVTNEILVAHDGVEALDMLHGEGSFAHARVEPDVVLLDLKLPKIDGLEVLQRLRADARTRTMPIVVLTSSIEGRDLVECYRLGCNSYVRKPVDFAEFVVAVGQLGHYWLTLNERVKG